MRVDQNRTSSPQDARAYIPLLRSVELFSDLPEEELMAIAGIVRRRAFRPGMPLFIRGDDGDRLFIIISGSVKIQRDTFSGRTLHLATRTDGEHFGELAMLDGEPRMADAITASRCELLILDRNSFSDLLAKSPRLAQAVMANLARRLRQSADDIETRYELDVTGRLADCLSQLAAAQPQPEPGEPITLSAKQTHTQLAEMIGAARESVTRAISDLESIGVIRAVGKPTTITILNLEKLRKRCLRW